MTSFELMNRKFNPEMMQFMFSITIHYVNIKAKLLRWRSKEKNFNTFKFMSSNFLLIYEVDVRYVKEGGGGVDLKLNSTLYIMYAYSANVNTR